MGQIGTTCSRLFSTSRGTAFCPVSSQPGHLAQRPPSIQNRGKGINAEALERSARVSANSRLVTGWVVALGTPLCMFCSNRKWIMPSIVVLQMHPGPCIVPGAYRARPGPSLRKGGTRRAQKSAIWVLTTNPVGVKQRQTRNAVSGAARLAAASQHHTRCACIRACAGLGLGYVSAPHRHTPTAETA